MMAYVNNNTDRSAAEREQAFSLHLRAIAIAFGIDLPVASTAVADFGRNRRYVSLKPLVTSPEDAARISAAA